MKLILITATITLLLVLSTGSTVLADLDKRTDYIKDHFGEMKFRPEGGFILKKGQILPKLVWDEPGIASALLEDTAIPTRWFDSDLNQVTIAENTGRYYVYGQAPVPDGQPLRRAMTCCCLEKDVDLEALALILNPGKENRIKEILKEWRESEDGVVTLLGKLDSKPPFEPERPGQWHMENATVHVRLKRKIRNIDSPPVKVAARKLEGKPASVLFTGNVEPTEADREFRVKMEKLFERWHKSASDPMSIVVARKGSVIVSRGYGEIEGKPVTVNTPMLLHSAMKPIIGIQLAMYVDRKIIDLDQPIGDFLPEFDTPRDKDLTFRAGHVHVTGIHFPWALAFSRLFYFNTWHEALIAHCPREWPPGDKYRYGCVGIILAVRAIELLTAKNYWEAMEEQLFEPLGIKDMYPGGTGFSAEDLARLGVMMANRGKYGSWEFFSEETYEAFIPGHLKRHFPKLDAKIVRGVGFAEMAPGFYGHGGGCGTCLMVEPAKHIVFAMTRMQGDAKFNNKFRREAVELLQELRKKSPSQSWK
ncbi:MAG: serine hydrolase domain-containing protein [Planctomycetota bacterium]|jgi:CubicO group peptidase (beta-lactamase class C family)